MDSILVTKKQAIWLNVWFTVCAIALVLNGLSVSPEVIDEGAGTLGGTCQLLADPYFSSVVYWTFSMLWVGVLLVFTLTFPKEDRYVKSYAWAATVSYIVLKILKLLGFVWPLTTLYDRPTALGFLYTFFVYGYECMAIFISLDLARHYQGRLRLLGLVWFTEVIAICLLSLLPSTVADMGAGTAVDTLNKLVSWLTLALQLAVLIFMRRIYVRA